LSFRDTVTGTMRRRLALLLLLGAPAAGGCFLQQKLDTEASSALGQPDPSTGGTSGTGPGSGGSGRVATGGQGGTAPGAGGSGAGGAPSGAGGAGMPVVVCDEIRVQARKILETNCAFCHQAPANMGHFDFVLDPDTLTTATGTTGARFAVPGSPDESRLYRRAAAGEMPPAGKMPRPSMSDVAVLREWIATCLAMGSPPMGGSGGSGAGGSGGAGDPADAGPPPGCGGPGQDCCLANTCNGGGCCVLGVCRGNGQACGDGVGRAGLPGMCTNGSCQNAGNVACGSSTQACCMGDAPTCTAPKVTCGTGMTCQACGANRQVCCTSAGISSCLEGLGCLDAGFGRIASCQPCGATGQRCCGNGPLPNRTCNTGLKCRIAGVADACGP
jgi:hypothetical protein